MYLPFYEPVSYVSWGRRRGIKRGWDFKRERKIDNHANPHRFKFLPYDGCGFAVDRLYPGCHALKSKGHRPRYKNHRRK